MKRIAKLLGPILTVLLVSSCEQKSSVSQTKQSLPSCVGGGLSADDHCWVSMLSLLGNPSAYDGMLVRTWGYVHFEFEGDALYLHREDFEHQLPNSLWISLRSGVPRDGCQDSYASVKGRFQAGATGHLGMWQGAVENVTECEREADRR
jgi:hypothetical protein